MTDLFFGTSGPHNADIMLVGEAWGADEQRLQKPFMGGSGQELDKMLKEAGLNRADILCTNVVNARPLSNEMWRFFLPRKGNTLHEHWGCYPKEETLADINRLYDLIATVKPKLIIAAGNWPLWALTDTATVKYSSKTGATCLPSGIMKMRGSMIRSRKYRDVDNVPVLPIIHPAAILRQWDQRRLVVHDLTNRVPMAIANDWHPLSPKARIIHMPKFGTAYDCLQSLLWKLDEEPIRVAVDIETVRHELISCIGFCPEPDFAFVIPFITSDGKRTHAYWKVHEEVQILRLLIRVLAHPNIRIEGQNFIYDMQYIADHWGVQCCLAFDTMLGHHLLFPGTLKGLDYLSTLYCRYHRYWKEDGKDWDGKGTPETHYYYNAEDCIRTREIATVLLAAIDGTPYEALYEERLEENRFAYSMMKRGVNIDPKARREMAGELYTAGRGLQERLLSIVPQKLIFRKPKVETMWYSSGQQQQELFYGILQMKVQYDSKTKQPSLGKKPMATLRAMYPPFLPLFGLLTDLRSVGVFQNHFIKAQLEYDGRMRCSYNVAGPNTFRWSSSTNAFDRGMNLQNIPSGDEKTFDEDGELRGN